MKITINADASKKRFDNVVNDIIDIANSTAHKGIDIFYYPVIRGETFSTREVYDKVEDVTEGTVYKGRISNGNIVFRIA